MQPYVAKKSQEPYLCGFLWLFLLPNPWRKDLSRMEHNQTRHDSLYREQFEHDACGIGAVVSIKGEASRTIVDSALQIVEKLEHRAGKDAAGETGDGVGIIVAISHDYFRSAAKEAGIVLNGARDYGIGMLFLPQNEMRRAQAKKMLEVITEKEGLRFLGWRRVPTDPSVLGQKALDKMPCIEQCFIERPADCEKGLDFDRRLYVVRRVFEQSNENTYVCSLSSRTIVYKGMFLVGQLREFYCDLQREDFVSTIAMVHSRFSTNTDPSWERAHPNRLLVHNGEINTIRGNADRMLARGETMDSPFLSENYDKILPVINAEGSDSSMLDNTLEFLLMNGMDLPLAMMICVPEPWKSDPAMSRSKKDMYRYYSTMMEPWDGPAALLFTDGDQVGACLDRNGLRPSRYYVTDDDLLILASEVGVLPIEESHILEKSRLQPGKMLLIDTVGKRIISDDECKEYYSKRNPYGEWLDMHLRTLQELPIPNHKVEVSPQETRDRLYKVFGYTYEDIHTSIIPMAQNGTEPIASMGINIPLAVLSEKHQLLFSYFKQLFAQVTNPPIDAIREEIVTDTQVYVGSDGNLLEDREDNCRVLEIQHPILTSVDLLKIRNMDLPGLKVETVSILFYKNTSLERAVEHLFVECDKAYKNGANIIILSDRGVDENHVAIPSLLAVSAMEQYLIRTKKRTAVSIILESAEPRCVHDFATLLGYGARAVNPYLAHECIEECIEKGLLDKDPHTAIDDYNEAILSGIVKIASKMGISTIQSYQSAQIFEIVGIREDVVEKYFSNTISRVGGIGLKELQEGIEYRHDHAFDPLGLGIDTKVDSLGLQKLRSGTGKEDHLYNPATIISLRRAVQDGDYERFKAYSALVDDEKIPHTLRGLLEFRFPETGIDLSEVEPAEEIVKRFKTGAMSYGSLSREAHECMAVAMNRLGARSNTGEGGELRDRFGTERNSAIKQVASGRFGVTSEYLVSAREIQIKMAQGAKPGEGGHLPGPKVFPWVATTRYSTPGVSLISPPPHHDIYSIEDLAQLIYDLKNANREARINVKLVSEAGVGTIASGVAKGGAEVILISGYDGGSGAAPLSSLHNAGLPLELGLAETHQTLIRNGLRTRVRLEADGKLMTGRDVAIACMLGAEEFGFATAPLIAMGCVMMRACNKNNCPVGIATQDPRLRARFAGKPEYVQNFMLYIAEELRELMARLGVRTVDELVGHTEYLRVKQRVITDRAAMVDLQGLLGDHNKDDANAVHFEPGDEYDFRLEETLDVRELLPAYRKARKAKRPLKLSLDVTSTDRSFGTILGSEITKEFGIDAPADLCAIACKGGGGQSFGAFIPGGLKITLEGDSNDYFGKGLSGGTLVLRPPKDAAYDPSRNIIVGNVALYGATGGKAFFNGVAGERFCVRNSGAEAVVEGVGDHGCEYMTGGTALIIGKTGKNFAAGMSGGTVYVLDRDHDLYTRLNKEMVEVTTVRDKADIDKIRGLLEEHVAETGSPLGQEILNDLDETIGSFKKIIPHEYAVMKERIRLELGKGLTREDAELEAFHAVIGS